MRSVPFPGYRSVRLGLASRAIRRALLGHRAELVHLASPFFLGAQGSRSARRLRLPVVAVYQADVPGYARAYHWGRVAEAAAWGWLRGIHNAADRTLAPSTPSIERLAAHGVQRVWMWGRGVDTQRFSPGGAQRCAPPFPRAGRGGAGRLTSAGWPRKSRSSCWPGWPGCPGCAWSSWAAARPSPGCGG